MATIATLPYCEHGDHDEDVFPCGQVTCCASEPAAKSARAYVTRGTEHVHPFTQDLIDAVVGTTKAP